MHSFKELIEGAFFHSWQRTAMVLGGIVLALALPITIILTQQQQDLRQRASGLTLTAEQLAYQEENDCTYRIGTGGFLCYTNTQSPNTTPTPDPVDYEGVGCNFGGFNAQSQCGTSSGSGYSCTPYCYTAGCEGIGRCCPTGEVWDLSSNSCKAPNGTGGNQVSPLPSATGTQQQGNSTTTTLPGGIFSQASCTARLAGSTTTCTFTIISSVLAVSFNPNSLTAAIGNGTALGGNCTKGSSQSTRVTCTNVSTGNEVGLIDIFYKYGSSTKVNTNQKVQISQSPITGFSCASPVLANSSTASCKFTWLYRPADILPSFKMAIGSSTIPAGNCNITNAQTGEITCSGIPSGAAGPSRSVFYTHTGITKQDTGITVPVVFPIMSPTPTITLTPTATTVPSPTPTRTPTPTFTPSPTAMPNTAAIALSVSLPGIGSNAPVEGLGKLNNNENPVTPAREVEVRLEDSNGIDVTSLAFGNNEAIKGTLIFDNSSFTYKGSVNLGNTPTNSYKIKIRLDNSLYKETVGFPTVTKGQTTTLANIELITGDIDRREGSDNRMTLDDYNLLIACYKETVICTPEAKSRADIDDNGVIDTIDLLILQRGFANIDGD